MSTSTLPIWTLNLPRTPPFPYVFKSGKQSVISTDTAFSTGLENRDLLRGQRACVVCGNCDQVVLDNCHIIPPSLAGQNLWGILRHLNYVPPGAKDSPVNEPRNGLTMCSSHHRKFDGFSAIVRYLPPPVHAYVWMEFEQYFLEQGTLKTRSPSQYHGRRLRLDPDHVRAPIYSLFLLQEMKARAFHPFLRNPVETGVNITNPQEAYIPDWAATLAADDQGNNEDGEGGMGGGNHLGDGDGEGDGGNNCGRNDKDSGGEERGGWMTNGMQLADVEAVLRAAQNSESWRECTRESISFTGTADKNAALYQKEMARASVSESQLQKQLAFFANGALRPMSFVP
ncbi:hypothetical protein C8F01DRAFT_1374376 [Mycena amicta]|nr:hypothetical protein C8F01DRAFT_1374376 [Mycena amicta]